MRFTICLTLLLMLGSALPSIAQELPNANAPLSPDELREGILRIEQGILSAKESDLLRRSIADREALAERERALAARELDTEKQRTGIAEEKAAVEKVRGDFYEQAFTTATQKTSFGCRVKRILTLGLAKCGKP